MKTTLNALTELELEEARSWVLDCCPDHYSAEMVSEWPDHQVITFVIRNYEGGLESFKRCCAPMEVSS